MQTMKPYADGGILCLRQQDTNREDSARPLQLNNDDDDDDKTGSSLFGDTVNTAFFLSCCCLVLKHKPLIMLDWGKLNFF